MGRRRSHPCGQAGGDRAFLRGGTCCVYTTAPGRERAAAFAACTGRRSGRFQAKRACVRASWQVPWAKSPSMRTTRATITAHTNQAGENSTYTSFVGEITIRTDLPGENNVHTNRVGEKGIHTTGMGENNTHTTGMGEKSNHTTGVARRGGTTACASPLAGRIAV